MKKYILAILTTAIMFTPAPASAQGNYYQPDPQVVGAINEMLYTLGMFCQQGNPQACGNANYLQQFGGEMLQAGAACQSGNNNACGFYQRAYQDLSYGYQSLQQEIAQMQTMQTPQGYGSTHEERMQAIQNFGDNNTANWNETQRRNDINHQNFINGIND